ncbi:MAG: hypothetical protein ACQERN_09520 [Thermodesulfobacteriota bacterium]
MANTKQSLNLDSIIKSFLNNNGFATKEDINQVIQKIEKLEKMVADKKTTAAQSGKKQTRSTGEKSASDKVLNVIANMGDGAKFNDIQAKTQLEDKKLRNIIYRLSKQGKIHRPQRGVYVQS